MQQSIWVYATEPTATLAGPDALTISAPGGSASTTITFTPSVALTTPVTFAVTGLPAGATATFNPAMIAANGVNPLSTQLTVTAPAATAMLHRNSNPLLPGGTALAFALCFIGFRKRRKIQMLLCW